MASEPYIQTKYGSCETGLSAMQMAAAIPMVSQNKAEMKDRRLQREVVLV